MQVISMQQQNMSDAYLQAAHVGSDGNPSRLSTFDQEVLPWTVPQPGLNPTREHEAFLLPPLYGGFFNNRSRSLGYEPAPSNNSDHHLRLLSDTVFGHVVQTGSGPFGLQAELGKLTAQEIMDAKAKAALKSHSEAERRRREKINNHFAKLRSLLPNTTKTDKASLLAEVIQHVKELKRQTSMIAESSPVPTEMDELIVDSECDEEGRVVIKASLCCEDRSDLLPDLTKTLKALRLRTLKAEISTVAGRVKNVLFITGNREQGVADDKDDDEQRCSQIKHYSISSIEEALKAVMEKSNGDDQSSSGSTVKRQRITNVNMY